MHTLEIGSHVVTSCRPHVLPVLFTEADDVLSFLYPGSQDRRQGPHASEDEGAGRAIYLPSFIPGMNMGVRCR